MIFIYVVLKVNLITNSTSLANVAYLWQNWHIGNVQLIPKISST